MNKIYKKFKRYIYRGLEDLEIDYEIAKKIIEQNKKALLIDVRSKQEYQEGHINGSINISLYDFERGNYMLYDKENPIILYCEKGKRSKKALQILKRKGFKNVYQLKGGLENM